MFDPAEQCLCLTSTLFTSSSHPNSQALKKFGGQELQSTILPTWLLNSTTALETASIKSETYLRPTLCHGDAKGSVQPQVSPHTNRRSRASGLPSFSPFCSWDRLKSQRCNTSIIPFSIQRWQFNHHGPMDALGITDGLIFNGKHLVFPSLPATEMCQVFTAPSRSWWNSQGNCSRSQACLQDRRN